MRLHTTEVSAADADATEVVYLHGLFGQGRNWTQIARRVAEAGHPGLLVDLPDHGRSEWSDRFDYRAMAEAVTELLATRPGPVHLVGHSMGGKVAMLTALASPDLVADLVVVDISPVGYSGLTSFGDYVEGMRGLDLAAITTREQAESALAGQVPDPVVRSFLLQNLRRDGSSWRWQMNLALLGDHLRELAGWPEPTDGSHYDGPVLWVAGSDSDYVQPAYAVRMRDLFPRVHRITIKNSGHWVHAEQPEVFVATLLRHLQTGGAPATPAPQS